MTRVVEVRGFTSAEFGERYGVTTTAASKRIDHLITEGKVVLVGKRVVKGHLCNVYDIVVSED